MMMRVFPGAVATYRRQKFHAAGSVNQSALDFVARFRSSIGTNQHQMLAARTHRKNLSWCELWRRDARHPRHVVFYSGSVEFNFGHARADDPLDLDGTFGVIFDRDVGADRYIDWWWLAYPGLRHTDFRGDGHRAAE